MKVEKGIPREMLDVDPQTQGSPSLPQDNRFSASPYVLTQ